MANFQVCFTKTFKEAIAPTRRHVNDLGYDLYTPIDVTLEPGEQTLVNTGIILIMQNFIGAYIWDKSSVALKKYITVGAGVIDSGYRGPIGVLLRNTHPTESVTLEAGTPIAQIIFQMAYRPYLTQIDENTLLYRKTLPNAIAPEKEENGFLFRTPDPLTFDTDKEITIDTGIAWVKKPSMEGLIWFSRSPLKIVSTDTNEGGSILLTLLNPTETIHLEAGSIIAEMFLKDASTVELVELDETERGERGFGGMEWTS